MTLGRPPIPLEYRLWPRVHFGFSRGCWLWNGCVDRWGNPRIWDGEHTISARKAAYELMYRTRVDPPLVVVPICHNPICVNPSHLIATPSGYIPGEVAVLHGYNGVFFHHRKGGWIAKINLSGGMYVGLGVFTNREQAWEVFCDTMAFLFGKEHPTAFDSDFGEEHLFCASTDHE